MRFTSLLVGVGDRRQPTPRPSPSQEGKTGDRRNRNERGGRSKNYQFGIFLP
ncbi:MULTISPECIES: hypothetical protein [Okeania]|uniref:hypothetical protein n=1 Tax=Okeania TaxID=1458928 RepID=UPI001374E6A7|nr:MULTISPECIES: hypothetical protein [Okeania]NET74558.1 hypothetical protein [Okeania sp. SIO1F9]